MSRFSLLTGRNGIFSQKEVDFMLKEWMNTPWAQEAHQASLNSLLEAARSGQPVHPAFASMAVELDE